MRVHRKYLSNRCGISTVELVVILAALVTVAVVFKGSLDNFTDRTAAAEFNKKNTEEIMTFGGEVKVSGSRVGMSGVAAENSANLWNSISKAITDPIRGMFSAGRAEPVQTRICNDTRNRSPEALNAVLDQFMVETAARYQPSLFSTYCNIFAWDATCGLRAEIPHWINRKTDAPYRYDPTLSYSENAGHAYEMNVNTLSRWMGANADVIGYREVPESEARAAANKGKPAVAIWENPNEGSSGHIVVLRPYDGNRGGDPDQTFVAQAGRKTCNYIPLEKVFSSDKMKTLKFYVHE